jgi:hypothetical protein
MAKFTWQDGTLVSKAKVEIGGVIYDVEPEEYSGTTPLSAANLNAMQDGIYEDLGDKSQLKTNSKTNLVNAINSIIDAEIYSTDEIKTNKVWIDGKPIYQKVLQVTASSNLNQFNNIYNGNIKDVISLDFQYLNEGEVYPEAFQDFKFYVKDGILKERHSQAYYSNHQLTVIVKYTKTTD